MKLLDAVRDFYTYDSEDELIKKILKCVTNRLEWLEEREPESDGVVYDEWSDKYDELDDIRQCIEDGIEENDDDAICDALSSIEIYQSMYGGLSRLVLE